MVVEDYFSVVVALVVIVAVVAADADAAEVYKNKVYLANKSTEA